MIILCPSGGARGQASNIETRQKRFIKTRSLSAKIADIVDRIVKSNEGM